MSKPSDLRHVAESLGRGTVDGFTVSTLLIDAADEIETLRKEVYRLGFDLKTCRADVLEECAKLLDDSKAKADGSDLYGKGFVVACFKNARAIRQLKDKRDE